MSESGGFGVERIDSQSYETLYIHMRFSNNKNKCQSLYINNK